MRCPNCGSEVNDGIVCFSCGEKINNSKNEIQKNYREIESKKMCKTCATKIGLWRCGSFFILIAVVFFFLAVSEYIKGIFIFAGVAACIINAILFFALGDIAQKVTEIHQHYQNKNI